MPTNGPVNYFNFDDNIVTVAGRRLGVFATDGGVSYAPQSDDVQSDVGADGIPHYSMLNDGRLRVTITLMEDSDSVNWLMSLKEAQQAAMRTGLKIPPLAFRHQDRNLGDVVTSAYAIFITTPEVNKARTIGTRTFQLELPYAKYNGLVLASNVAALIRG